MLESVALVRRDPRVWFEGFGYWLDDENSRQPTRGRANVLQRRAFEHYRRCLERRAPCRMVIVKYRRAGSSTGSSGLMYHHVQNFRSRAGVIGKDYKSSSNMLEMVKTFGKHDDFPGWSGGAFEQTTSVVPWEERVEKEIATQIHWPHGSRVELYTAENPASARSAGLQAYHATECGVWPTDGVTSADETLTAMRNTLPKKGFHLAIEESTAKGAQGAFYKTCREAQWPDYADWWKKWESDWPLSPAETEPGRALQFVLIFAAWFEDERHFYRLNEADERRIRETLDADPAYHGEQELIDRYGQQGPRGQRLGSEVDATLWEQLAWRRVIIRQTGGLENFRQEYPSNPREAFRSTGSPVFDQEGLSAIDAQQLGGAARPEYGLLEAQQANPLAMVWRRTSEQAGLFHLWEHPKEGRRYIISVDSMSGAELIAGSGTRDRHSILVLRDVYQDERNHRYPVKVVGRIQWPCQLDNKPLAEQIQRLSLFYGGCPIAVESNCGVALITSLRDDYRANLYIEQFWNSTAQALKKRLGFRTDEESRRLLVAKLQEFIREQKLDLPCPHVLAELKTFVFDRRGKAIASSGNHDDDVVALGIGLTVLPAAQVYRIARKAKAIEADAGVWKDG